MASNRNPINSLFLLAFQMTSGNLVDTGEDKLYIATYDFFFFLFLLLLLLPLCLAGDHDVTESVVVL